MTVREAGKGIVRSGGGTYRIGYTDLYEMEQETELSAFGMKDLEELWSSLCPEFECEPDSVNYVERVGYEEED